MMAVVKIIAMCVAMGGFWVVMVVDMPAQKLPFGLGVFVVVMLVTMSMPVNMIHGFVVVLVRMRLTQQEPHSSDHQGTGAKVLE